MATVAKKAGAKGQKIGRCKNSPSHKNYHAGERWKVNKVKKLRRHIKEHPQDERAASTLTLLRAGKPGPAATFPEHVAVINKHVPDGINDVEMEFRKHHYDYGPKGRDGKRKRVVVLEEQVAKGPTYWVESDGRTLDVGPDVESVERAYGKSRATCALLERRGDKTTVLRNKCSAPLMSLRRLSEAFAG